MAFFARSVKEEDFSQLMELASHFNLLNLPANEKILKRKIEKSVKSFSSEIPREEREYIFVLEELASSKVVGCSLIIAKHGTEEAPHYYFKVDRRERNSEDLGVGFIHHVLQLKQESNGPTEIGGLLVHPDYRGNSEKLGKFISLIRFLYMGRKPERFQEDVLCEFAPKLSDDGKSHLWEELGRKFTGLTYEEADRLSLKNKDFIKQLFPIEGVYLNLLSPEVRMSLGKVSEQTEPAKHMLSSIGFAYQGEIDPFDGGPHFSCKRDEIHLVKNLKKTKIQFKADEGFVNNVLVMNDSNGQFHGFWGEYDPSKEVVFIKESSRKIVENKDLAESYFTSLKE